MFFDNEVDHTSALRLSDYQFSNLESAGAAFESSFDQTLGGAVYRYITEANAENINPGAHISQQNAQTELKQDGYPEIQIGKEGISRRHLDLLKARHAQQRELAFKAANGPTGFIGSTTRLGAELAAQFLDPLTIASAFLPGFAEASAARGIVAAGESALGKGVGRAVARAAIGGVEGGIYSAGGEAINYAADRQDQFDYDSEQFLKNVALGSFLGGGLHSGLGAYRDILSNKQLQITQRYNEGVQALRKAREAKKEFEESSILHKLAVNLDDKSPFAETTPIDVHMANRLINEPKGYMTDKLEQADPATRHYMLQTAVVNELMGYKANVEGIAILDPALTTDFTQGLNQVKVNDVVQGLKGQITKRYNESKARELTSGSLKSINKNIKTLTQSATKLDKDINNATRQLDDISTRAQRATKQKISSRDIDKQRNVLRSRRSQLRKKKKAVLEKIESFHQQLAEHELNQNLSEKIKGQLGRVNRGEFPADYDIRQAVVPALGEQSPQDFLAQNFKDTYRPENLRTFDVGTMRVVGDKLKDLKSEPAWENGDVSDQELQDLVRENEILALSNKTQQGRLNDIIEQINNADSEADLENKALRAAMLCVRGEI